MPQTIRFADTDITVHAKTGRILVKSFVKALRSEAFARRVRVTLTSKFDGSVDGSVACKREISAAMLADEITTDGGSPKSSGLTIYVGSNGFEIHVADYCNSWDVVIRDEEIRRLETVLDVMSTWGEGTPFISNQYRTVDVVSAAREALRIASLRLDAFAFDDTMATLRGHTDALRVLVALERYYAEFVPGTVRPSAAA